MPESRKSSTAKKLIQAAALAAVLVPLGSVMVETSPITCTLTGSGGFCSSSGTGSGTVTGDSATFSFVTYDLTVDFDAIDHRFTLSVDDQRKTQGDLEGELVNFPTHTCVPIADGSSECVEFVFGDGNNGPPPEPGQGWHGLYDLGIRWDANTNEITPGTNGRIHVLHNPGADGDPFTEDFCARFGCTYNSEPGTDTRGDAFHSVLVTSAPTAVPEPGSVLLVATGVGALYHRRRRKTRL